MISLNKILHALSNSSGPFVTPIFATDPEFVPAILKPDELALRAKLCLDRRDTDYYLRTYVALLNTFPDIQVQLNDSIRSYDLSDISPAGVTIEGGDFSSFENMEGYFTDPAVTDFPIPLNYSVTYVSPTSVELRIPETGLVARIPCRTSGAGDQQLLHFDWPPAFPFTGPLRVSQTWVPGAGIAIDVEPSTFPFDLALSRIAGDACLYKMLMNFNLMAEFVVTVEPREKLAIAFMVLALSNEAVYGTRPTVIELPGYTSGTFVESDKDGAR